jgi:integrase
MKLTQKTVAALTLPEGKSEAIFFDDELAGFGVRIRAGGSRTWVYQYKVGSQHRRITLGSLAALTPARARESAAELHAAVRLGRDPAGEKFEGRVRAAETMAAILPAYLARQRGHLRPRSYVECERHLLKNCKPLLGLLLSKIDRRAVAARISDVANTSGAVSANRTRAALSAFFSWTMREGLLDNNPVIGTNRQKETSRSRVLSDDELKIILSACGSDDFGTIIRLLMATGQRASEVSQLRWSEVLDDRIVLPPSRVKNNRLHTIPLARQVRAIFDGRERNGEFVFGRRQGRPFGGWSLSKATLDQRISAMGRKLEPWVTHDLRRTMATRLAESGTAPHIIEAILNHVSGHKAGVAGVYNRASYEPQKRIALQQWSNHLEGLVSGKRPSKVVNLRRL